MKTYRLLILILLASYSSTFYGQQTINGVVTSTGISAGVTTSISSNSSFFGYQAGNAVTPTTANARNSFFGSQSGKNITTGTNNTFMGYSAGIGGIISNYTTYIGAFSGQNLIGDYNVSLGYNSLSRTAVNTTGLSNNTAVGYTSGANSNGSYNVFLGTSTGNNSGGSNNVFLGAAAGYGAIGSNNVVIGNDNGSGINGATPPVGTGNIFIGNQAVKNIGSGMGTTLNNQLVIDNTNSAAPLIWGDFAADQVKLNGKVGIGAVTSFPTNPNYASYKLFVTGGILSDEVRVSLSATGAWPDYVFTNEYNLKPLSEVESYIKDNGHLPNVPSACQVKEEGIELGNMSKIQQEKIEELTLYVIALNKKLDAQQKQIDALLQNK
jgi:hypothetical protein